MAIVVDGFGDFWGGFCALFAISVYFLVHSVHFLNRVVSESYLVNR